MVWVMMFWGVSLLCGLKCGMKCLLLGRWSRVFLLCNVLVMRKFLVCGWYR